MGYDMHTKSFRVLYFINELRNLPMCMYRVTIALDNFDISDWLLDVSTLSCHSRKHPVRHPKGEDRFYHKTFTEDLMCFFQTIILHFSAFSLVERAYLLDRPFCCISPSVASRILPYFLVATYLHCRLYWMGLLVQNVLKSRMLLKLVEFTRDGFENIATK